MTRDEVTAELLEKSKTYDNILLECATGTGKSRNALLLMQRWESVKVLLCVAEVVHKKNWQQQFRTWGIDYPEGLVITTYASLHKYANTEWDLIILDECHHINTEIRTDILETIFTKRTLALSATVDKDVINTLEGLFGKFYKYKISLQQAIESKILPVPRIKCIPLKLNVSKYDQIWVEQWGKSAKREQYKCIFDKRWQYMSKDFRYMHPNVHLEISCNEQQYYNFLDNKYNWFKNQYMRTRQGYQKNQWMLLGSKRKLWLGGLKTQSVIALSSHLQDKRYLCFCSSVLQAEALGGTHCINSGKRDNQSVIDRFNEGKINSLYAVNMLKEGQNLHGIEVGIITQLDGNTLSFIQKFGRILRAEHPLVYIFYYKDTRDEEYLNKALTNIDKSLVEWIQ